MKQSGRRARLKAGHFTVQPTDPAQPAFMIGKAIDGRVGRSDNRYARIRASNVSRHARDALAEGIRGGLVHPLARPDSDPFSLDLADLLLFHPFEHGEHLPADVRRRIGRAHELFCEMAGLLVKPGSAPKLVSLLLDESIPADVIAKALFAHQADIATAEKESITLAMPEGLLEDKNGRNYFRHYSDWASVLPVLAENTDRVILPCDDSFGLRYYYDRHREFVAKFLYGEKCLHGNIFSRVEAESRELAPQVVRTNQMADEVLNTLMAKCRKWGMRLELEPPRWKKSNGSMARKIFTYTEKMYHMAEEYRQMHMPVPEHIFAKLRDGLTLRDLPDIVARELVVETEADLWKVVKALPGIIEKAYGGHGISITELECDDYVNRPKPNGYRAYHIVVKTEDGAIVSLELKIVTRQMKRNNDYGNDAAHHLYKGSELKNGELEQFRSRIARIRPNGIANGNGKGR